MYKRGSGWEGRIGKSSCVPCYLKARQEASGLVKGDEGCEAGFGKTTSARILQPN